MERVVGDWIDLVYFKKFDSWVEEYRFELIGNRSL